MFLSVIVPFYHGNQYMSRLMTSINSVKGTPGIDDIEIIIVNDSPDEDVCIPEKYVDWTRVIRNDTNCGIQKSRAKGYENAKGNWLLFIDQDDEIIADGFARQIELTENADVVVGNGIYRLGKYDKRIYNNKKSMEYLIKKEHFIRIRNLIPSPGECLIRKDMVPDLWTRKILVNNGADDWMFWLLLFQNNARFMCNSENVYIHNDSNGENLSADLSKMRRSAHEMAMLLFENKILDNKELRLLKRAIDFKFLQDTKLLGVMKLIRYFDVFSANLCYRITLNTYAISRK